jgi:L-ornithine N5-oxygenase
MSAQIVPTNFGGLVSVVETGIGDKWGARRLSATEGGDDNVYDLVGVGYGPANLALAIALDESDSPPRSLFLERESEPRWQREMLLAGSDIQHNPIRDLVSLRNPRSRYSFINYLFENDRLMKHLNLPASFPLRSEYTAYVDWVRRTLPADVRYGVSAERLGLGDRRPGMYSIALSTGEVLLARSISLGPGRTAYIPIEFVGADPRRVFHLTDYMRSIAAFRGRERQRFAIVGGSQSAVELALDLNSRFPDAMIDIVTRSWSLRAKDHSPFSEEIYFPSFTDYYYAAPEPQRRRLDEFTRPTNYSAADLDVLERLYVRMYEQELLGEQRIRVLGHSRIDKVRDDGRQIELSMSNRVTEAATMIVADAVILATGFRDMGKGENQEPHHPLLTGVAEHFQLSPSGYLDVNADYSLRAKSPDTGPIYLNGLCESTHGIGDAGSFSLLSIRARTITNSLIAHLYERSSAC